MGRNIPYEENHKVNEDGELLKKCSIHDIYSPEDESPWFPCTSEYFYKTKANKTDGLHPWCKQCSSRKSRKNQLENPERTATNKARWRQENADIQHERDRIWKAENKEYWDNYKAKWHMLNPGKQNMYAKNHRNHDIAKLEWEKELKIFNHRCAYCGISEEENKLKYRERLHKDHVDHEGYNDLRNAVPACTLCNSHKWQYNIEEWYRQQEFFGEERLRFIKWWTTEGYKDYIETKPPYRIVRERDKGLNTYHFNLWTVDKERNTIKIISTKKKKKDLDEDIKEFLESI